MRRKDIMIGGMYRNEAGDIFFAKTRDIKNAKTIRPVEITGKILEKIGFCRLGLNCYGAVGGVSAVTIKQISGTPVWKVTVVNGPCYKAMGHYNYMHEIQQAMEVCAVDSDFSSYESEE